MHCWFFLAVCLYKKSKPLWLFTHDSNQTTLLRAVKWRPWFRVFRQTAPRKPEEQSGERFEYFT